MTYTGDGTNNREIAHSLGSTPGMIIIKRTDSTGDWIVYHRSLTSATYVLNLNASYSAAAFGQAFSGTSPTSSVFTVGSNSAVNASGGTYVAYLFAHDAGGFGAAGTDSVVSCGSVTADSSGAATVNLGWEPQFVLFKSSSGAGSWRMLDTMRGFSYTNALFLNANNSNAESDNGATFQITPTGFAALTGGFTANATHIYLAIRRGPMKTPTDATKVFKPVSVNGIATTGFPVDAMFWGIKGLSLIHI